MITQIPAENIILNRKLQNICKKPFYNHPQGCPNWGKKEGCPPNQPLLNEIFDFNRGLYLVYTEFPVGKFAEKMRLGHPQWASQPRQWYNPRRWQPVARKEHKAELESLVETYPGIVYTKSPEAHGVDVTALMAYVGINLEWEWPPKHSLDNIVYQVSMAGYKKIS